MSTLSWLEPRTVTHAVNGEELVFHEVSVGVFSKLRPIAELATLSVMQLMRSARDDAGSMKTLDQEGSDNFKSEDTRLSVSVDLARYHDEKRGNAVTQLTQALFDEKHKKLIATFIVDSLREEEDLTVDALLNQAGGGVFVECLTGALKANAKVFGPFGPAVEKMLDLLQSGELERSLQEKTSEALGSLSPTASPSSEDEALSPTI